MSMPYAHSAALAVCASLLLPLAAVAGPVSISLADIVGGGSGKGTGTLNAGINQATGATVTGCKFAQTSGTMNTYRSVANPFIDGVFMPDGGDGTTGITVSSTGLTTTGVRNTGSPSWDYILNGNPTLGAGCPTGTAGDYYATSFGFTSHMRFHANNGITFDLDAIEAANGGLEVTSFSAVAAVANSQSTGVQFTLLLDGVLTEQFNVGGNSSQDVDFAIGAGTRFLTLITADDGNFSSDQSLFGNPTLTLGSAQAVSAPGTLALAGLGLACVGWQRRRRSAAAA